MMLRCAGWGDSESGVSSCVQIGIPTIILVIIFSQYLRNVRFTHCAVHSTVHTSVAARMIRRF